MTALTLQSYQQAALDALQAFARAAQLKGPAMAFGEQVGRPYNRDPFGETPCICLRIPTGGGKTLLAAHALNVLARQWRASDAPVVLWPVPSDTIRSQTLKALQTAGHPYREALEAGYGTGVRVCVLEDLANNAPPDWGQCAVVVVATIQSFRIDDTDKRNVYSFSESFERHFKGAGEDRLRVLRDLPDAVVTAEEAAADKTGVLPGFVGLPRWSLANWLALHEPLLIVDEAHNTKTDTSFTALKRLNPSAILELTATPYTTNSAAKTNVLYHVSAQELAAESMIKLPIAPAEHPQDWQRAVFAAVQNQRTLEGEALKDEAALPLFESNQPPAHTARAPVATDFVATAAPPELQAAPGVEVVQIVGEQKVVVTWHIGSALEALLLAQVRGPKKQEQVQARVAQHNALVAAQSAPASRGEHFAPIPALGYRSTPPGQLWPLEREITMRWSSDGFATSPARLAALRWRLPAAGSSRTLWPNGSTGAWPSSNTRALTCPMTRMRLKSGRSASCGRAKARGAACSGRSPKSGTV